MLPPQPTSEISENRATEWRQDPACGCAHTQTQLEEIWEMIKPSWQKLTWRRMNSALAECYSRKNRQQELMGFSERRGRERNKYLNAHYVSETGC